MNLGRFYSAILSIKTEIKNDNNFKLLRDLQLHLQNFINQKTSESAKIFTENYSSFINTLENADSNFTYPTRRKIYREIGATEHVGIGLANKIKTIMTENKMLPEIALAEIKKITAEASIFLKKINTLNITFHDMGIEYDELDAGKFEIGFSFPHEVIGTDVESLEKEFHKLDFALKTLQEISVGEVSQIRIKTISASEWQVFIDSGLTLAACTVVAIERIVALYKNNLEIKLLKQQLDKKKLPKKVTKPLQDHIEQTVKAELRKIGEDLVEEFYKVKDDGRKNELTNKASQALQYLANRMDCGTTVEVHAKPLEKPKEKVARNNEEAIKTNQKILKEYKRINKIIDKINQSSKTMLELEQSTEPILSLQFDEKNQKKNQSSD